jgi:hypothetical protein
MITEGDRTVSFGPYDSLKVVATSIQQEVLVWDNHCRIDLILTMQAYDFEVGTYAFADIVYI